MVDMKHNNMKHYTVTTTRLTTGEAVRQQTATVWLRAYLEFEAQAQEAKAELPSVEYGEDAEANGRDYAVTLVRE